MTKEHQLVQDLEKKNTELRDARIQVEKLLNASETCTVFINDKFEIDSFTQTAERVLKLTKDDIGQKINGYLDTLNFDAIYDKLRQVLDTSVSFETELMANNGSYYHLKLYSYLLNETQTTSIILSLVDITDYKNSIKLVRETQSLVELAAKHARIGIWNWEVDNDKLEWNDGMYDLFSIPKESFGSLYESFIEKVLPEDREEVNTKVNEALEEKNDFNTEYRIYGPNDSIKYIHAVGQYTPSTKNKSGLLTGMCFDITALKQAEEELSKIALYDHVTGIPNRANFLSELPKSIARAKREKTIFAVFFL
ncbi:PAS domain-containing protein [Francisellaceae bacterium]|nr:PAS domain-containing protein [Francisellaceae bacterium]